jgi:toxin-antitoxin system PIN domain toxin
MIAVDTNILIYSHREESPFHVQAKHVIEQLREARAEWAIPWPCIHEFIAIATHPRVFKRPTPLEAAFASIEAWLAGDNLHLIAESEGYLNKLRDLSTKARLQGARIHDARIGAICLHHGVHELWTADRDFSAFPQLITRNPLIAV